MSEFSRTKTQKLRLCLNSQPEIPCLAADKSQPVVTIPTHPPMSRNYSIPGIEPNPIPANADPIPDILINPDPCISINLPNHPPLSPAPIQLSPKSEDLVTPNCSPPSNQSTPVIVTNPSFLPPPPLLSRYSPLNPTPNLPPKPPKLGDKLPRPSGRWDNITNTPSYQRSDQEFWDSRSFPIPVRSTVESNLSGLGLSPRSDISSEAFEEIEVSREKESQEVKMEEELKKQKKAKEKIKFKMSRLKPNMMELNMIDTSKLKLDDIMELVDEFGISTQELFIDYPTIDASVKSDLEADVDDITKAVDDLEVSVYRKIKALEASSTPSVIQPGATSQPITAGGGQGAQSAVDSSVVVAKAGVKYKNLLQQAFAANQDMEDDGVCLGTASDDKISKLVKKIPKYETTRDKIQKGYEEYLEFTAVHKPDAINHCPTKLNDAVRTAISTADTLIDDLEKEDEDRELATMVPRKTEKFKWPTFSGKPGESFFKFKEQFFKVAKQNQTSKADQITKLRENLKDFPLTLVPETMLDITEALKRLGDTYGDPQKLVNFEVKKLEKVTMFPNCDDGSFTVCTRSQAEWLLQVETILDELDKMGKDDDASRDLQRVVYGPQTTNTVLGKFPWSLKDKLISAAKIEPDRNKERLVVYKEKLKEWSEKALEMDKYDNDPKPQIAKKTNHNQVVFTDPKVNPFNPPKPLPSCIVCVELQKKQQIPPQLGHISAHVTGCPNFIEMDNASRNIMCNSLKLCRQCLKEYQPGHEKTCMVTAINTKAVRGRNKYQFTCKETSCLRHMWLCSKHITVNKESMNKRASTLNQDFGLKLVYLLDFGTPATSSSVPSLEASQSQPAESSFPRPKVDQKAFKTAEKKLKKHVRKQEGPVEIVPVPEGDPMFMFQALKGRTEAVFAFYDSGCSNACLQTGVPGDQLKGQVLAKGPFTIEGVNGVLITAQDEWLVHLDREDGRKQELRAVTLDKITADCPRFNIEEATRAVKKDKSEDSILQNCSLPSIVGGTVHILIGIQYNSIFPKPIHRLPNGLEIFKCVLASHDNSINATIGGPHSSFRALADHIGGSAPLMAHFLAGLQQFKKWGPPSIKVNPFTYEEESYAKIMNASNGDTTSEELIEVEQAEEYLEDLLDDDEISPDSLKVKELISSAIGDSKSAMISVCQCGSICNALNKPNSPADPGNVTGSDLPADLVNMSGADLPANLVNLDTAPAAHGNAYFTDTEKITPLANLRMMEDGGLLIEYRCVKCRDCPDCKNAEETEKTSLREEAEEMMIKESVKLDIPNKRIICRLPLRGPEKDFLTTNKERALTVLDQQCRKYHGDEEIREVALKGFRKLFDNGHASLLQDIDDDTKQLFLNKDPQYFIPWRLVFKDSISTPCRAVLDASSKTKQRSDGSGGRCLNDLVVKGKVTTINLVKMLLRFIVGRFALNGDLQQFYNACKLEPDHWNLQRFLYRENMDPKNPVLEGAIKTLIYGVKSVSRQSEHAIFLLADYIRDKLPEVAALLEDCRYVDDEGESKSTKEQCYVLIEQANEAFGQVNLVVKEWIVTGDVPSEKVSKDGVSVEVGGMKWFTVLDTLEVKIPPLHFGKKMRGRLSSKVKIFGGSGLSVTELLSELNEFVPKKLSRRMVASKRASIFDLLGKLAPMLISSSILLRLTVKATQNWDTEMTEDLRKQWLKEFLLWEKLRGMQFNRAMMPEEAINTKMRVIIAADAANPAMVAGAWAGFRKTDGTWSCQLLLGRALLTAEDATIPKSELTALTCGSNLGWLIRNTLKDWVDSYILIGDSIITLCWVTSDKKRLSLFHRNRVIQIRRGTELEKMYHVRTDHNPADVGTRPDVVSIDDVQQNSKWISGSDWMKYDVKDAVDVGILKPVSDLRLNSKEEYDDFHDGCVFDRVPEILTRGHVLNQRRLSLIQERASFSQYLLVPTKFSFRRTVRVYSYVFSFIYKLRRAVLRRKSMEITEPSYEGSVKFSIFTTNIETVLPTEDNLHEVHASVPLPDQLYLYYAEFTAVQSPPGYFALSQGEINATTAATDITDKFINMALTYLYRKASAEVKKFNGKKVVEKIGVEKEQIIFSKGRILDTMSFAEMGDLNIQDLPAMGIKAHVPVIDRHSPLAYSIAQHIHWNVSHHRGMETCNRLSLQNCLIIQGMTLYRELAEECLWCAKKRKRMIEVSMGPVSDHQLSITPPFWCCQIDLFGPIFCYVPGYERNMRGRNARQVKTWILTTVCVVTKLVNAQVVEKSDASGIMDALTRLGCEVGMPSMLLTDQDSTLMKALREAEVNLVNLKLQVYREKGIQMEVCSVGGHNEHGLVERIIRSLQESLDESGLRNQRLTATGLQTLSKLVENDYNNLPAGFKYDRDQDNTEVLKILTPNMMRHGRINTRSLSGPLKLPNGASDMVERVEKSYKAWYKVWYDTFVPKLLFRPKWFKDECDLKVGDIVYFQKSESELSSPWTVGMIAELEMSRDNLIRKVVIKYRNASESKDRTTRRNVRTVCKIWSVDDFNLQDDLVELHSRLRDVLPNDVFNQHSQDITYYYLHPPQSSSGQVDAQPAQESALDSCCCLSHCSMTHQSGTKLWSYKALVSISELTPEVPVLENSASEPVLDEPSCDDFPVNNLSNLHHRTTP